MTEGVAIGFAMCWLTTGFIRDAVPTRGALLQGTGCLLYGLQIAFLPIVLRHLGEWSVTRTAAVMAAVATLGEWVQSSVMTGAIWCMTALFVAVGNTPLAQWASVGGPLFVSALVYVLNFVWLPERSPNVRRRWRGPLIAVTLVGAAWLGGERLSASVRVEPLLFSALLVQPHLRGGGSAPWRPWETLDRMTRASLERDGRIDLIVWPETSLSKSPYPEATGDRSGCAPGSDELTLWCFESAYRSRYQTTCLVGVPLTKREVVKKYGLDVLETRTFNSACLLGPSGECACHEKLALLPLKEGLPDLWDSAWVRRNVLPYYHLDAPLQRGTEFRLLPFRTLDGRLVKLAASVCYESHLPWLPQFERGNGADAIVHLLYDGNFSGHPEWTERQLTACRYRAIESRKWNLVCSTWSGSAIIDPQGEIVMRLTDRAGIIRTDTFGPDQNY